MNRRARAIAVPVLLIGLIGSIAAGAKAPAQAVQPTDKPFLWRIEGPVPSYLYGTIHVPDPRVLAIPEVVLRALDTSDVLYTELPFDPASMARMSSGIQLPAAQNLRTVVGDNLFTRLVNAMAKGMGLGDNPAVSAAIGGSLLRLKPWAAVSQLAQLDYVADVRAGRQPLDMMLYNRVNASKETRGLETLEEQLGVFDSLTETEQVRLVAASLEAFEQPPADKMTIKQLVNLYLAGDLTPVAAELNKEEDPRDEALRKKLMSKLFDERNVRMTERIAAACNGKPPRSYFFAVGAGHYAGDTGLLGQLAKRGFKVTRIGPADAALIVRKPAA